MLEREINLSFLFFSELQLILTNYRSSGLSEETELACSCGSMVVTDICYIVDFSCFLCLQASPLSSALLVTATVN